MPSHKWLSPEELMARELKPTIYWAFYGLWNKQQYDLQYPLGINAINALAIYYEKGYGLEHDKAVNAAFNILNGIFPGQDRWTRNKYWHPRADDTAYGLRKALLENQSKDEVEEILKRGPSVVEPVIPDEEIKKIDTPLQVAASYRPELVEMIIKAGAKVERSNWFGKTPLMYAVQYSQIKSVKKLLQHGANINAQTQPFDAISSYACGVAISAALRTPLMYAAWHSNPEVVQYLLKHGADKTMEDSNGLRAYDYLDANEQLTEEDRKKLKKLLL